MMEGSHDNQEYIRVRLSSVQYITKEEEEKIILQQVNICMSFTMKMLVVSVLVLAMMALTSGAEAEATNSTEPPPTEKEVEPESTLDKEAEEPEGGSDEEEDEAKSTTGEEGEHKIAKRATRCPCGWALYRGRCFRFFPHATTWAIAQRRCQGIGGTLASVRNRYDENWMKRLAGSRPAWIGLSDAQQEHYWLWINGERITYWNFCRGQPDNAGRKQHCVQFNWSARRCWDDDNCLARKGYICAGR